MAHKNLNTDLLIPIASIVGPKGLIENDDQLPYLREWRDRWRGKAAMIVAPASTQEVCAIVQYCAENKIPITPQGGNTGLVGGQIPTGPEILISMKRMHAIHEVSPLDSIMVVDAGVTLVQAQQAALEHGRLFPLSIGSEGTCQIGGIISTNAGGVNVLRYGNTRDLVLGLEAVMPNGDLWNGLGKLRKDNTGYDLKQLLIGGEGTLGIITKAVLKLFPVPVQTETIFAACPDAQAVIRLLAHVQNGSGGLVSSFELMERLCVDLVVRHIPQTRNPLNAPAPVYALIELSAGEGTELRDRTETILASAIEGGFVTDAVIAENETQRHDFWRIRHSISEALNGEGVGTRHDVSVPTSAIPSFLVKGADAVQMVAPGARIAAFGHVGDGNVHYDVIPPDGAPKDAINHLRKEIEEAVYDLIATYQGSISAEHGIGTHKKETLAKRKSPVEMEMMRAIKNAIDPGGIMNPGKML